MHDAPKYGFRRIVLTAFVLFSHGIALADTESFKLGQLLLEENCKLCHAIGLEDLSGHPNAPAFRDLSAAYPVEHLAESLAEGIVTGHPDMPSFEFKADQVDAIIEYLQSIQSR